jgi:toxin ParE1/3/4
LPKPVQLRRLAGADIDAAVEYYSSEAGPEITTDYIDALEQGLAHIGRHPRHGSLRFAYELDIPELRSWPLTRFPYVIFYVERETRIDVWRILHSRRDIPGVVTDEAEA